MSFKAWFTQRSAPITFSKLSCILSLIGSTSHNSALYQGPDLRFITSRVSPPLSLSLYGKQLLHPAFFQFLISLPNIHVYLYMIFISWRFVYYIFTFEASSSASYFYFMQVSFLGRGVFFSCLYALALDRRSPYCFYFTLTGVPFPFFIYGAQQRARFAYY